MFPVSSIPQSIVELLQNNHKLDTEQRKSLWLVAYNDVGAELGSLSVGVFPHSSISFSIASGWKIDKRKLLVIHQSLILMLCLISISARITDISEEELNAAERDATELSLMIDHKFST